MEINHNEVIDRLGGPCKLARMCEVTKGAVSQWRKSGIPNARLMYLRLLRPDVFVKNEQRDAA